MKKENNFFKDAQDVVRLIPHGRVTSYGAVAKYLSAPRSARMVGYALKASTGDETVPAHRVVNRLGMLSGKSNFETPNAMELQLLQEGVKVEEGKVINFQELFWDPKIELNI